MLFKKLCRLRECLIHHFKKQFSIFKQDYTYFHIFFHLHIFLHMFLSVYTKHPLKYKELCILFGKNSLF